MYLIIIFPIDIAILRSKQLCAISQLAWKKNFNSTWLVEWKIKFKCVFLENLKVMDFFIIIAFLHTEKYKLI